MYTHTHTHIYIYLPTSLRCVNQNCISHLSEWPESRSLTNNKCCKGFGEKGTLLYSSWGSKIGAVAMENYEVSLKSQKYYLAIPFLGICQEKTNSKRYIQLNVHSSLHNSQ